MGIKESHRMENTTEEKAEIAALPRLVSVGSINGKCTRIVRDSWQTLAEFLCEPWPTDLAYPCQASGTYTHLIALGPVRQLPEQTITRRIVSWIRGTPKAQQ